MKQVRTVRGTAVPRLPMPECSPWTRRASQAGHPWSTHRSLILDSRVLRDQELNERREQRFASLADIVHKLEETQVEGPFLL
jgi:hypothetical protein